MSSTSFTTCSTACRNTPQLMQSATVRPWLCQKAPVKMEVDPDSDNSGTRYACSTTHQGLNDETNLDHEAFPCTKPWNCIPHGKHRVRARRASDVGPVQ